MGLDMWLEKRHYVTNYSYENSDTYSTVILKNGELYKNINCDNIQCVAERVARWRKANAIHNWFVNNVQNGEDDCKEYWVGKTQLESLLNVCKQAKTILEGVSENRIAEVQNILPTLAGFFFGSTDIDDWYLDDLKYTIDTIEKSFANDNDNNTSVEYYYSSSW